MSEEAEKYIETALGGNLYMKTLKPKAFGEIMQSYSDHQFKQRVKAMTDEKVENYKDKYDDLFPDAGIEYITGLGHGAKWLREELLKQVK